MTPTGTHSNDCAQQLDLCHTAAAARSVCPCFRLAFCNDQPAEALVRASDHLTHITQARSSLQLPAFEAAHASLAVPSAAAAQPASSNFKSFAAPLFLDVVSSFEAGRLLVLRPLSWHCRTFSRLCGCGSAIPTRLTSHSLCQGSGAEGLWLRRRRRRCLQIFEESTQRSAMQIPTSSLWLPPLRGAVEMVFSLGASP